MEIRGQPILKLCFNSTFDFWVHQYDFCQKHVERKIRIQNRIMWPHLKSVNYLYVILFFLFDLFSCVMFKDIPSSYRFEFKYLLKSIDFVECFIIYSSCTVFIFYLCSLRNLKKLFLLFMECWMICSQV